MFIIVSYLFTCSKWVIMKYGKIITDKILNEMHSPNIYYFSLHTCIYFVKWQRSFCVCQMYSIVRFVHKYSDVLTLTYEILECWSSEFHAGGRPTKSPVCLSKPTCTLCLTSVGPDILMGLSSELVLFFFPNGIFDNIYK